LGSLDTNKLFRYTAEIREAQDLLAQMTSEDVDQCSRDSIKMRAMKYTLIVLVEAICNLCRHILAKKAHVAVEEYVEAILKMDEKGFLSGEIANSLIPLTKLRHQLIHGYWKTDDRRLFVETKNSLKIIDEFLSEINHFIS
jgi:uncharacterized protein YutE (UPF0331/DUF86 family)